MANTDIRLAVSFKEHRKRKKLNYLMGLQKSGTDYLIDLWIAVANDRPDGVLTGWLEIDIALAAGWDGDPVEFAKYLVDAGWLTFNENSDYAIHDWEEYQAWACNAKKRSNAARRNAQKRWAKRLECETDADGNADSCEPHKDGNAPSPSPNPSPNPSPKDNTPPPPQRGASNGYEKLFNEKFWPNYPRKVGKQAALKAFKKIKAPASIIDKITAAIEIQKQSEQWTKDNGQYIPNPATWLNQGRWEDELANGGKDPYAWN